MGYTWTLTGAIAPQALTEGRLQLHYAVQFIAAPGMALAAPQSDGSQMSLSWQNQVTGSVMGVFVGKPIRGNMEFRIAIDPISFHVLILDAQNNQVACLPLTQKTMAAGLEWLKQELDRLGVDAHKVKWLDYPPDDFPDHAIAHGATFDTQQSYLTRELTLYYANADLVLGAIAAEASNSKFSATAVTTWPHHFDMATQITPVIDPAIVAEAKDKSIGVGFSPGDRSYNQPYWYVTPWPDSDAENLPALEGKGSWHTQEWIGAILIASEITKESAEAQQQQVQIFLNLAIASAQQLLNFDG